MLKKITATFLMMAFSLGAFADEGMWLPLLIERLNHQDMQKYGLNLTAEEIYSVNHSSLKDAIVSFSGFCSGELISDEGLLLTNHHCGYGAIQSHSTVENDYLSEGFWAMSREEELPNEGLYARFLIRMEDVTEEVISQLNPMMSEEERAMAIASVSKEIAKEAKGDTHYDVVVKEFFAGNEFYMFVYETFTDVRLVGAPPESIGKFGGDTDNWMWPRQTGDFSLFRVYSGPDGKPADYAPENIPLDPKHYLPISLRGVQEGDFAMVMGYPGSTDRYLTSFGVQQALEQTNPTRVKIRDKRLEILKEDMDLNPDVRLKYASKYAGVSNYWKYFIGQSKGLKNLNVLALKQELEDNYMVWAEANEDEFPEYLTALDLIRGSYDASYDANLSYLYLVEAALGTEIIRFANSFRGLETALAEGQKDQKRVTSLIESLRENTEEHFKNYNAPTDKKVMAALLKMYYEDVPQKDHPAVFDVVEQKYNGNFNAWVDDVFKKSVFDSRETVMEFLNNPDVKKLKKDPAYIAATSFIDNYNKNIAPQLKEINAKRDKGNRIFVRGLRQMLPDRKFYPNANSTMRISYGQVLGYDPRDAVSYDYYTTLDGVMEKMDNSNPEFVVPDKLVELYEAKDYGQYVNEKGELVVAFITNNDITGGNSGSPVIDANGFLIGTAFDGNWEAMSGDIAFEPELQRCINVDIRYTLFIIDKMAGASHLIEEMTLITEEDPELPEEARLGQEL